jgi:hypothetical protein
MDVRIVALHTYDNANEWNVQEVQTGAELLTKYLSAFSGLTPVDDSPSATVAGHRRWLATLTRDTAGPLVLYWSGHGETLGEDRRYIAALKDSTSPLEPLDALTGESLKAFITNWQGRPKPEGEPPWLLIILDTCQSVSGAWEIWRSFAFEPENMAILATSSKLGSAFAGRFPARLKELLETFGENDDHIKVDELLRRVEAALDAEHDGQHLHTTIKSGTWPRLRARTPLAGNRADVLELHAVLAEAPEVVRNHFYAKASGAGLAQPDWHFTGRESERSTIASWLRGREPRGLVAVTGLAGAGKSALLGMVLAGTSPELIATLTQLGVEFAEETQAPEAQFTTVLHLNNRSLTEVIHEITSQEGLDSVETADALIQALSASAAHHLILADALDESRDPLPIARLLHRLAAYTRTGVLVGTRRSLDETPDEPIPSNHELLDTLHPDQIVSVERNSTAYRDYVMRRLRHALSGPPRADIERVADQIVAAARTFLYVRLAVEEICADPSWTSPGADLKQLLVPLHTRLFERAITRLRTIEPATEHLLHSLAYAKGNGFPRTGRVWEVAGSAVAGTPLTDRDVDRALNTAAAYIVQDAEFGNEVYRLGHRTFVEYYRGLDTS